MWRECLPEKTLLAKMLSNILHEAYYHSTLLEPFVGLILKVLSHVFCITYLITQWRRVLLEKLRGLQLVKKFSAFYGTWRLVTAFTSAHHLSQFDPVHIPTSHFLKIYVNIILPSAPRSPQWSLSPRFPTETLRTPLSSPIHATCPAHLILLDFITCTILGEGYRKIQILNKILTALWTTEC